VKLARTLSTLAAIAALALAGCSSGNGPTAPVVESTPPPAPVIRTPTALVLTTITVLGFDKNAPDGGDWDWALLLEDRKPDIWVSLKGAPVLPLFNSDLRLNAEYNGSYNFTRAASDADGYLPRTLPYGEAASIALIDDDPFGDTKMSEVTFHGTVMYRRDNAAGFDHVLTGANGFRVRIKGSWVY